MQEDTEKDKTERVVVISGAFGDVGMALCTRFAQSGFTIAALYNNTPESKVHEAMGRLTPGNHAAFTCDLASSVSITKAVSDIKKRYGHIDAAVHAAWPAITRKKLLATSEEEAAVQYNAGALGSFIFLQALGTIMQEQKSGVLIGITTSAIATDAQPGAMGAYVSAKYALYGLLKTFAQELADSGVRVHAIAPGFMRTGMNRDLPPRLFELLEQKSGPLPTSEQVAEAATQLVLSSNQTFSISI